MNNFPVLQYPQILAIKGENIMKSVLDRFLEYIAIDTTSVEDVEAYPSSEAQLELGKYLAKELAQMGAENVNQDEYGYVTAVIPATQPNIPVLGLLSHLDTSNAVPGGPIHPKLVPYTGSDIVLNEEENIRLCEKDFPDLSDCLGETLIVTDGKTLLGADDKAGVAEIMTLAERLLTDQTIPHGEIRIAFTPDEETGCGTKYFDTKKFGADFAYTVDGGPIGELEYENFNAASASITIYGQSVHPGSAKGKMKNAAAIACELQALLPAFEQPAFTEGYEGFFHLLSLNGGIEMCNMKYAIREHDKLKFEKRKKYLEDAVQLLNERYGSDTISLEIRDQYFNMKEIIKEHMELIEIAKKAYEDCQITPIIQPVRGGTDGAKLSYMGLPCPNLSTGGYNFHSRYEFIPVRSLEMMVEVLTNLVTGFASENKKTL